MDAATRELMEAAAAVLFSWDQNELDVHYAADPDVLSEQFERLRAAIAPVRDAG